MSLDTYSLQKCLEISVTLVMQLFIEMKLAKWFILSSTKISKFCTKIHRQLYTY